MKIFQRLITIILPVFLILITASASYGATLAIIPSGGSNTDEGRLIINMIVNKASTYDDIQMVDRKNLDQMLDELAFNAAGFVDENAALKLGRIHGAKYMVFQNLQKDNDETVVLLKIINTETTLVKSKMASYTNESERASSMDMLVGSLVREVGKLEVASIPKSNDEGLMGLINKFSKVDKPSISVSISERHIGVRKSQTVAETEMIYYLSNVGFDVKGKDGSNDEEASFKMIGSGVSEYAFKKGDLISVKGQLEVRVIDSKTGKLIAIDREAIAAVDITEIHASQKAFRTASKKIALRIIPKILDKK